MIVVALVVSALTFTLAYLGTRQYERSDRIVPFPLAIIGLLSTFVFVVSLALLLVKLAS